MQRMRRQADPVRRKLLRPAGIGSLFPGLSLGPLGDSPTGQVMDGLSRQRHPIHWAFKTRRDAYCDPPQHALM